MKKSKISIYSIILAITIGYFAPVAGLTLYSKLLVGQRVSWEIFSFGIGITLFGSLLFLWLLSRWKSQTIRYVEQPKQEYVDARAAESLDTLQEDEEKQALLHQHEQLLSQNRDLTKQLEEIQEVHTALQTEHQEKLHAIEEHHHTSQEYLQQQQTHIRELQETIAEQKILFEKKQHQVTMLETKVNDLTYEIKTLLKLAESHVSSLNNAIGNPTTSYNEPTTQTHIEPPVKPQDFQIQTPEEASQQLRRCLDIAQKITGSHRFGSHFHSMMDSPLDSFTLDLRRLCDTLRSENNCGVLLYSPKDNQLIFSNNQIKSLTGWSPEKFTQSFFEILQNNNDWKQSIASLAMRSEVHLNLSLKTKWGHEIAIHGQVGMIPTGIFRQHAIAVLYI